MNLAPRIRGGAMPGGMEHRRHRRYQVSLPVAVWSPEEKQPVVQTASRDISAKGIYFTLSPGVEVGTELEFDMVLPPQMCQGKRVRVHCRGRVVRREALEEQGRIGVAAAIEEYEFVQEE